MSSQQARDSSGQFASTREPADILNVMEPLEPYTTGELADALDWPQRTVYHVLDRLADDGTLRKKKPDSRRAIWMLHGDETS